MRVFGPGLIAVIAACGPSTPTARPVGSPAIGDYSCRIQEAGYDYPAYRCVVRPDGGRFVLEKLEGNVRFRGVVASTATGFQFAGEVFCPYGDCTEPVRTEFRGAAGGTYVADFSARRSGPSMTVTLAPRTASESEGEGGKSYGGDVYGGDGYGGAN